MISDTALRDTRRRAGISLLELATESKVSVPTIQKAEKGEPIQTVKAGRITTALNRLTAASPSHTIESLRIQLVD